jgi:hypothetical protein
MNNDRWLLVGLALLVLATGAMSWSVYPDDLIVGMNHLRCFTRPDVDRRQCRHQSPTVEHAFNPLQQRLEGGDLREGITVGE